MDRLTNIEPERKDEIVLTAIERELPCVLTVPLGMGWQTCKARFMLAPDVVGRIVLSAPEAADSEEESSTVTAGPVELRSGQRVGVSFRRGHKKCMFSSKVECVHGTAERDPKLAGCVELQWPETIQEFQRRVYQRAQPTGRKILVRFWPGGVAKRSEAEAGDAGILTGVLQDLSAGGIRILTTDVSPDHFEVGMPIGCAFTPKPRGDVLVLDAVYRHFQPEKDGTGSIGLQFVGLEVSDRGKSMLAQLARIVTDFQRGTSRNHSGQSSRR